ncbi:AbrB/MazE/SpoVT family DNA-binding domain-containing protein [Polaromonas sp.]|jgi:antitoxin MazE|uniref:AbrB/MazE/SpoVT family DNA-binding domain-containing protein n=1 Tax=Polaromonas sp. TaxID=1869339 RepID=UPI002C3A23EA|nr:AbrB/MazE/SpoVT family DNA-binding domain-containing protein [Polaromonas sp.]HQS33749.1 AbrB/MazE/SpoVT family DNA-binding domain-containing protein [Polaromonas sp.]HQS92745.1 AbrB/MazE/SpoVT family DNA-binding domain-containing protein [Polaromonas sp.]
MELQIGKWGNSLAVRLPATLVKALGVSEGSVVTAEVLGDHMLRLEPRHKQLDRTAFVAQLRKLHQHMPVTQPLDKDELSRY